MTVAELITKLEAVRNKTLPVVLTEWTPVDPMRKKHELDNNRIVLHPHRVSILTD